MSHTRTVTIPRIDADAIRRIDAIVPNIGILINLPIIETTDQAVKAATDHLNSGRRLATQECITAVMSVDETEHGWDIVFDIMD